MARSKQLQQSSGLTRADVARSLRAVLGSSRGSNSHLNDTTRRIALETGIEGVVAMLEEGEED